MSSNQALSVVTNQAKIANAQMKVGYLLAGGDIAPSYKIVGFSVGEAGYDPDDTSIATAPESDDSILERQIFPSASAAVPYKPITTVEWTTPYTPTLVCHLDPEEGIGALGNLGLWARYTTEPDHPMFNQLFLHTIVHFPLQNKLLGETKTWRISLP